MTINHRLLVKLWDKAVGTPDYDKEQWVELSNAIMNANEKLNPKHTLHTDRYFPPPDHFSEMT